MNEILNTAQLNAEFSRRAAQANLDVDCLGDGVFNATCAIVAQNPGDAERIQGRPLVGNSGRFLWEVLRRSGIERRQFYVTNVIKRQVLTKNSKLDISKHEQDMWETLCEWELSQLPNLKYVIVLGGVPLHMFTGESKISDWRGSVIDCQLDKRVVTVIVCNNPAFVLREPKGDIMFRFDLHKAKLVLDGKFKRHDIKANINPTFTEAKDWIAAMENDAASGLPISFDIEVVSNETACIGFASNAHEGYCINFRDLEDNRFGQAEEIELRSDIQRLLGNPNNKIVAQNGVFDSYWTWYKDRIRVDHVWFDTLLAHHLLYPTLPHNLGFLTSQYTTHPFYKDEGKNWREGGNIDEFWEYNVKDVCITRAVQSKLHEELRKANMERVFFEHVMHLQPHLVYMTVHGVKCDAKLKDSIAEQLAEDVEQLKADFWKLVHEATGEHDYFPNPGSWKQLQQLFFNKLGLVGRGRSTDKDNRKRMREHHRTSEAAQRMLASIDKWSEESKFLSTYAKATIDEDERMRCEYKQFGVAEAPGRLSSSGVMWGSGMNMQNQPERAYPMYIADEGYEFTYFDMSQIEARYVACLANIVTWLQQFERARLEPGSYDAHCALASDMFNVPYEEVPKYDRDENGNVTIRFIAKRCRHGLNYRMGPDRLADTTGLSTVEAERNYHLYHRTNPEIREWWDRVVAQAQKDKVITTPFGRRWILLEKFSDDAAKSIIAFVPQSTAGDKVASVIYKAHEDRDWPRTADGKMEARVVLNIHDALITLNRPQHGEQVRAILKKHAEEPVFINGHNMIVPAEFGVSQPDEYGVHRWSTIKKVAIDDSGRILQ